MRKNNILKKFGLISVFFLFCFLFISCDGNGSSDGSNPNGTEETSNETEETSNGTEDIETPGESGPPSEEPLQTPPLTDFDSISAEDKEATLADLIINESLQQRAQMQIDPILSSVARERAEDMAKRGYFNHTNPDGKGANFLVTAAGYTLPDFYGKLDDSNNIESIAVGYEDADDTLQQWIGSDGHRKHVFGEALFYQEQIDFGVGFAADLDSPFRFYWVFISARHPAPK